MDKKEYQRNYMRKFRERTEQCCFHFPVGTKAKLKAMCLETNKSLNRFLLELIEREYKEMFPFLED